MDRSGKKKAYAFYDADVFSKFSVEYDSDKIAEIIERKLIISVLEETGYIISESAIKLGISNKLLIKKMLEYKI
jgi:DNA-binding NtrC family response regulator